MGEAREGITGGYVIRKSGYHPQAGDVFSYKDAKYDFWFYVEAGTDGGDDNYDLIVTRASTERLGGEPPVINVSDQASIEGNIREYFQTFGLFCRPITASSPTPLVDFTWANTVTR